MVVLGIDIGSTNCVMASVGRGKVFLVRSEVGEIFLPSLVGYTNERRLFADAAASQAMSNYKSTCRNMKNLLGRFFDDPLLKTEGFYSLAELGAAESNLIGYKVSHMGETKIYSATRVLGSLLQKLKEIASHSMGSQVTDVVVACPGWYSDINRSALLAATQIAGLKCLRIFNEHTAIALDYGIHRLEKFSDGEVHRVVFVSMGHCNTSVSIVDFTKDNLQVLSEASSRLLGGRNMDTLIACTLANRFKQKTNIEIETNRKAWHRVEDQASKIKRILSANTEATCNIECLIEDHDLYEIFTREEFNSLCQSAFVPQFIKIMHKALDTAGVKVEDLHAVEVAGGCTRIPWVRDEITKFFGKEVSRTLRADECVARGCALQAAISSVHFKVREFGCMERLSQPIAIAWPVDHAADASVNTGQTGYRSIVALPMGMNTRQKKKLRLTLSGSSCILNAYYANPGDLPDGVQPTLGRCQITLPDNGAVHKVAIDLGLNEHGIFEFDTAWIKEIFNETESTNNDSPSGEESNAAENSQENNNAATQPTNSENNKPATIEKPKFRKVKLPIQCVSYEGKYSAAMIEEFIATEKKMIQDDLACERRLALLNEYESEILSLSSRLSNEFVEFTTKDEKANLQSVLMSAEDWLSDEQGTDTRAIQFQLDKLRDAFSIILNRLRMVKESEAIVRNLAELLSKCQDALHPDNKMFDHVSVDKREELKDKYIETQRLIAAVFPLAPLNPDQLQLDKLRKVCNSFEQLVAETLSVPPPVQPDVKDGVLNSSDSGSSLPAQNADEVVVEEPDENVNQET